MQESLVDEFLSEERPPQQEKQKQSLHDLKKKYNFYDDSSSSSSEQQYDHLQEIEKSPSDNTEDKIASLSQFLRGHQEKQAFNG